VIGSHLLEVHDIKAQIVEGEDDILGQGVRRKVSKLPL
jgi:hypothetical protein